MHWTFNRDKTTETARLQIRSTLARSVRRLRDRTRRSGRREAPPTFVVRYLGLPEPTILACALDLRALPDDARNAQLAFADQTHPPAEARSGFARFEIDVTNLLRDDRFESADLSVRIGGTRFALPYQRSRELADEPWHRPNVWGHVTGDASGSRLIRRVGEPEVVVTSLVSTATGIRFSTDQPAIITMRDGDGQERRCTNDDGQHHLDLAMLAHRGVQGPTFWRATARLGDIDVSVVVDNRDLADPSTAYSIPMLITSEGGNHYYAKPYFARRTGQLSVRTGIKTEAS